MTHSLGDPDIEDKLLSGVVGGVLSITTAASFPSLLLLHTEGGGGGSDTGCELLANCISKTLIFGSAGSLFSVRGAGLPGIVSSHRRDRMLFSPSSSDIFSCF
mgnify:FL=1